MRRFAKSDIASSLALLVYGASMVITPVCLIEVIREFDLSLASSGQLGSLKSLLILFSLLASGPVAFYLTKRISVGLGTFLLGATLLVSGFAGSFWILLVASACMGIGCGLIEALVNPLVHEAHPDSPTRYLNIVNAFYSIGVVAAVLLSGYLLEAGVSWRLLFKISGVLTLLSSLLFFSPKGYPKEAAGYSPGSIGAILKDKRFYLFALTLFFAGAAESALTYWSASYIRLALELTAVAAGGGTALFALGMTFGRLLSGKLVSDPSDDRVLLLGSSLLGLVVSLIAFSRITPLLFFLLLFVSGIATGPFWPTIQSLCAWYIREDSTTIFILLSCAGIPGVGAAAWGIGLLGDLYGLQAALLVVPVCFAFLLLLFLLLRRPQQVR